MNFSEWMNPEPSWSRRGIRRHRTERRKMFVAFVVLVLSIMYAAGQVAHVITRSAS